MKHHILISPALIATLIFACSSNSTNQDDNTGGSDGNSSMTFALSGGDFTNNSVRICGSRTAPDPKYRCNSSLTPDIEAGTDAGDACPCFNFNPDGSLVDGTGAPAVITGLCPSADFPPANWDFSYALFASPNCQGTQLNDGDHNFTCYDSKDIATQQYANQSIDDVLVSGPNTNHILCNTVNASKQWNFASCATATTPADTGAGNVRFDCGCTLVGATCVCGDGGGVTESDLETGCSFDPATCDILCPVPPVPQGSCATMSAQSMLVSGTDVIAYVPHARSWVVGGPTDVSVVNVEGGGIIPTRIPTTEPVTSCASNSNTGETVCTGGFHNTVYTFRGTDLTGALPSSATGVTPFPAYTTYGVIVDGMRNRALISMSIDESGTPGYQFLDLATNTFLPPFEARFSVGPLIDPVRNLVLSPPYVGGAYSTSMEIINVSNPSSPQFFDRPYDNNGLAVAEDCETGIMVVSPTAAAIFDGESYIADLSQASFTPGSPGSWTGPAQTQRLNETGDAQQDTHVAVAQGTHQGVMTPYQWFSSPYSPVTAIQLPSVSGPGTGIPSIPNWVTCSVSNFQGSSSWTTTAYKSPTTGHAMATIVNTAATEMAVVDLTLMLDPAIVPRTVGGHACAAGTLPDEVAHVIEVP